MHYLTHVNIRCLLVKGRIMLAIAFAISIVDIAIAAVANMGNDVVIVITSVASCISTITPKSCSLPG